MDPEIKAELDVTPEWWQMKFNQLIASTNSKTGLFNRVKNLRWRVSKKNKEIVNYTIRVIEIPKRWWQAQKVRLKCSCGWESEQTWFARPALELAYTTTITMRAIAEIHFNRHRSQE